MMQTLETLRDTLREIDGVQSCKIGVEEGISPSDYPLIRIVPDRVSPDRTSYSKRTVTCSIYFGMPIANSEGLEDVYEQLFVLEDRIREALRVLQARYLETILDSDRLPTYKLAVIRSELLG